MNDPRNPKPVTSGHSIGETLKFLGFAVILVPVGLGLGFLAFNMAKYNYERLPNPIAFIMMVVTGAFAVGFAIAPSCALIGAMVGCVQAVARWRRQNASDRTKRKTNQ